MRYYEIAITPITGSAIFFSTLGSAGTNNGSALRVDFDIYQAQFHQVGLNSWLRIYGISYKQIAQIANLNPDLAANKFATIQISVGMSKGLPFAKPSQSGVIVRGIITQAFANWQGNEITLDLVISSIAGSTQNSVNIPFSWKKDTTLESAVKTSLEIAYPGTAIVGSYSKDLIYTEDQAGIYEDIEQFATYVYKTSKSIITSPTYQGASITVTSDGFNIADGTTPESTSKSIGFTDIIGNLTWLNVGVIQAKLVMRADLVVNQFVTFPRGTPVTNVVNSFSQFRNNVSFQGKFQINQIRHVGSSRQPSADNWVTIIDCIVK